MSNSNKALALVGSPENAGVIRYMNRAHNLGVPGMKNLNNRLKSTNIRGIGGSDWELMKLILVLEPILTYLLANVYVVARRKVLKATGRAPSMNTANNRRLLTSTIPNANLAVLNNPNALRKAMNNAARSENARSVVLIQNALHTVVFGLITVMGTVEILNSYMSVSNLGPTTPVDEFFDVAYNAIILMSRIVLPLILAIVQKVFKRSSTGTRAVILSSVAAVLVATRIDNQGLNILKGTVKNARNSFMKLQNKTAFINKVVRLIDPSIANKHRQALGLAITSARDTMRSIIQVLGKLILSVLALNKGKNIINTTRRSNNGTPRLTNGTNNVRNMNNAARTLLSLRNNNN